MNHSDTDSEDNIDNLITQIGELNLSGENFINLKTDNRVKVEEINPNIVDVDKPESSRSNEQLPLRNPTAFDRPTAGYAGLAALKKVDPYTPVGSMKNEPINPFGIYLDVDCVNNTEEAIDKWETATRIAISVNKMDYDITVQFIEKSLVNSAVRFWKNLNEATKKDIIEQDKDVGNLITRAAEALRLEFAGEGNFLKDPATINKYSIALLRLQLCDICEIDKYICVFQDYYYHIYNRVPNTQMYLPLFFTKIPDPWGKKLIDTYTPGTADTLGKRIAHLKDKMSEWCGDAILAKMTRGLKKRISLCCDNVKMPLMIGCDSYHYYGKIKRKYKKRKHFKRRYFKRRKVRYYKKKGYKKIKKPNKPNRSTYKRNNRQGKSPNECKCYYCHEIGHYAHKCPKKFKRNQKMIEFDDEINDMINKGEFIQINEFEDINDIDSDESIFILTDIEAEHSSSEESMTE